MDEDMDCPHIIEAAENLNIDVEQMRTALNNRSCNVCVGIDQLWMCMECRQILCGRNAMDHSSAHFRFLDTHCIFLNVESAAIFCYKCNQEIQPKSHDDELNRLRQFILYNRGPVKMDSKKRRRRRKAPKAKPKKGLKRGPNKNVGFHNANNNNCVMNVILQAFGNEESKITHVNPMSTAVNKKKMKSKKPKRYFYKRRTNKKIGIRNYSNNCFMNAVWQSLRHIRPFIYCLKLFKVSGLQEHLDSSSEGRNHKFVVLEAYLNLLISLVDWKTPPGFKYRDAISPVELHTIVCRLKPRYDNSDQHDAHEFFMFTLDTLHSELRDEKTRLLLEEEGIEHPDPNKIDTLMSSMFRGFLLSEVCCLNCNTPYFTKDTFTDMSLQIPHYKDDDESRPVDLLTDCLEKYMEVEVLNENNLYSCEKCQSPQRSTKRFWVNQLPNVLCLHLKRFRWTGDNRDKVHTHIKFPLTSLNMSEYLDNDSKQIVLKEKESSYMFDLVSIVVHNGEGGGSGHYISYALEDTEGQWYEFNDEKVYLVEESFIENLQAYMLFYIKRELRLNLCV